MKNQKSKIKNQKYHFDKLKILSLSKDNTKLKKSFFISFEFCAIVLSFAVCALNFDVAHAESVSLSITPPTIVIQTEAPALIEKQLQITNNSDTTQTFSITFKPFVGVYSELVESAAGKPLYKADLDIFQHAKVFDNDTKIEELTLLPKQQKNLKLHISLSEDQPNQDYYFSILLVSKDIDANEQPEESQNVKAQTYIQPGIAANVLLSVFTLHRSGAGFTGKKQPEGIIASYKAPFIASYAPVEILLTFQNTGSYLLIPQGAVLITNMFGQTVGKIPVPRTFVLANSKRDIKLTWNENILFGPYNATLYLDFADNKNVYFKRSTTFIGFPIAIGGSIITVIILITLLRNRLKKYQT